MSIQIYLSPLIGTGTKADPLRPKLKDILATGDRMWSYESPARAVVFCVVDAADLSAINTDAENVPITAPVATRPELTAWLDTQIGDLDATDRTRLLALRSLLDNRGINTANVDATWTVRDVCRLIIKLLWLSQRAKEFGVDADLSKLIRQSLNDTLGTTLTAAERTRLRTWFINRGGLSTAINTTTTVRQALTAITDLVQPGQLEIGGEKF